MQADGSSSSRWHTVTGVSCRAWSHRLYKAGTAHVTESVAFKKSSALLDIVSPSPRSLCFSSENQFPMTSGLAWLHQNDCVRAENPITHISVAQSSDILCISLRHLLSNYFHQHTFFFVISSCTLLKLLKLHLQSPLARVAPPPLVFFSFPISVDFS